MDGSITDMMAKAEVMQESPIPLVEEHEAPEYPLDALGEILGGAAKAIAECVQVPGAIAGQSVLAAASLAVQSIADVAIDGRESPTSLFCLTIAESGDRKSAADSLALKIHKEYQRELYQEHEIQTDDFNDELDSYKTEKEFIKKEKGLSQSERTAKLKEVTKPSEPATPCLICQEPTLEGLQKTFASGRDSMGLFNDEGGQFFGGHAMNSDNMLKSISGLSLFWDGADIVRTRGGKGENVMLTGKRLTIHLMVQPVVVNKILSDPVLQGQGFVPRFLIATPKTIAGTRLYNYRDPTKEPALQRYWDTMNRLLRIPSPNLDEDKRPTLTLEKDAKDYWVEVYNTIESNLGEDRSLSEIRPAAGKAPDYLLRIAGVLALVENPDSKQIRLHHVQSAAKLETYFINEALRASKVSAISAELNKANELLEWMKKAGSKNFSVRKISRNGPSSTGVRGSVAQARKVISTLIEYGWVAPIPGGLVIEGEFNKEVWRLRNV
ncbi:MAG: DUF3987 domain-containing protein [Pseudomonadales bacterium]|nr:DUF3987 domain-containing protein [Pseudomonadales bacterium]